MKCKKCGYELHEGDRMCPVCGAKNVSAFQSAEREQARAREQAQERAREQQRAREKMEQESRQEQQKEQPNEESETITVDPRKIFMHDNNQSDGFDIFDLFSGGFGFGGSSFGFGGNPFGSQYSSSYGGQRRQSFGLFDIIEDMFFGGSSAARARSNRAIITEKDDFYYIDKYDEVGFPIFTKDKLINISQSEFQRIKRESRGEPAKFTDKLKDKFHKKKDENKGEE